MLITGVIDDQVHHVLHPPGMQTGNQCIMILHRAVRPMDVAVIGDIVAHVDLWGGENRGQPDHVDAERLNVREPGSDTGDVPSTGAGGVEVGGWVDLVDA